VKKGNVNQLQPMEVAYTGNCVAELLITYYENAPRAKLTPIRKTFISDWGDSMLQGCTLKDISYIEQKLKKYIIVKDITVGELYNSGRFQTNKKTSLVIYQHNGHAWLDIKQPQVKEIKFYEGDGKEFIKKLRPGAIWILDNSWSQFITHDGTLYRTYFVHHQLSGYAHFIETTLTNELTTSHIAFKKAKEMNKWVSTPVEFAEDIQSSCVEHGFGGLWNRTYDKDGWVCIDVKDCYPAAFEGHGECKPYYKLYGHPSHFFKRIAANCTLKEYLSKVLGHPYGFAYVTDWKFQKDLHPIFAVWYGRHMLEKRWTPFPYYILCLTREFL
jgi:hypothetical protein